MRTLIIEIPEPKRLGELYTAATIFTEKPELLIVGDGRIPGEFSKVYQTDEKIGSNLLETIKELVKNEKYEIILFTSSVLGTSVAGPLAGMLSLPIITEVTGMSYQSKSLVIEKPIYGGKALTKLKINKTPAIITIRRKCFDEALLEKFSEAIPIKLIGESKVQLLKEHVEKTEGTSLEDANIIFTGGRGIGSSENFEILNLLAKRLNGAVGASRGAVDEGWASPQMQIGQTGKMVAPTIYFAVGVSGASQHLAGITNAKCVIAVNIDEEANIFRRAKFGIVCDFKKIMPLILERYQSE